MNYLDPEQERQRKVLRKLEEEALLEQMNQRRVRAIQATSGGGSKPKSISGGDGYTYTEVNISSAELINPPSEPISGLNGVLLLPPAGANQYYEWKMNILFIPGSIPYDTVTSPILLYAPKTGFPYLGVGDIEFNEQLIWQFTTYSPLVYFDNVLNGDVINPASTGVNEFYSLTWSAGTFTTGDGTMKVKIWYKVVDFG